MPFAALIPYAIQAALALLSYSASKKGNKKEEVKQYPTLTPEQGAFQNKILQMLGGQLESPNFETFAAPYKRDFQENIVPGIAERFAGLGGLSSSGFTQSLGQAGGALEEKLAALQEGLKSDQFSKLLPFAFGSSFHTDVQRGGGQNWLAELLGPILQSFGSSFGQRLGQGVGQIGSQPTTPSQGSVA
jgi:hypothetical protein